ncbi:glycoside hydrolase family 32 protein [Mucilaginibacter hurinus]|uniref:Glycoside hydrolase family 32 protein n=2 Tax=Mucilaginibacter hurinus TaxID=2201324 RepID=A0A367GTZ4_9SPHI|nr:glycoside hydrolase family 32 protein [Mucilaginibacter hurinus]
MIAGACSVSKQTNAQTVANEPHRPQFHFTPKAHWMNDPNGMVFLNGTYHLFFQHNPGGTTWGPMHWGHATSKDMMHWEEQPIALYPDSLGTIFSGSAVVDKNNTAGFGKNALVAIYTCHNKAIEDAKTGLHQYQGIAYSTDEGKTWTKYEKNPVLPNPGIWDFRDPKVRWYEAEKKWVMTLATKDRITFYSSPNLKQWTKESEFGEKLGAHGGVWECPDLFPLDYNGQKKWVLLVSINPGGPNGGSATQYFVGHFDGKTFIPDNPVTRWVDYGTDNYAGVTFSNLGDRQVFMGWMSNWQYAERVPTQNWRSANTLPRELGLAKSGNDFILTSTPVKEMATIINKASVLQNITVNTSYDISDKIQAYNGKYVVDLEVDGQKDIALHLTNAKGDLLVIGYEKAGNAFYIDRTKAGEVNFEPGFAKKMTAPRNAQGNINLKIIIDAASAEVFADSGRTVLTAIFFPQEPLNLLHIKATAPLKVLKLKHAGIATAIK